MRQLLAKKKWNTAAVADRLGLPRKRVRQIVAGSEPMTVDEFVQISEILELTPEELVQLPAESLPEVSAENVAALEADDTATVTPWGNHPMQLFEVGFVLGCDFLFVADTKQLADSGIPAHVLDSYNDRPIPLKLDAAYHRHHDPTYTEEAVSLTLSFDALYKCRIPWAAVMQVAFYPETPEVPEDPDDSEEEDEKPGEGGPPFLRLVT